ncbi:MAG TPA: DUF2783 domain-containing protein [Azospirillum sp.]|nr:DUF2783 domain-containing protein [Azospirillum sp.]
MTHDELYEALVEMHRGLDAQQSLLVASRLILLLAQHVKDDAVIHRAIAEARGSVGDGGAIVA